MTEARRWIFLRGLVRWKVHWGDFVEQFKREFPNEEVILLDLPGFGDFHQELSPSTMEGIVDHLDARVDWSQGPYHIVALSLGAMAAARWAERRSSHIQKMFLINTSDSRSPFYRRFRLQNFWLLLSRIIYRNPHFLEKGILDRVCNRPEIRARFLPVFEQSFREKPFTRQNFLRQIRVASKTRFPDQASVPTIFFNSTADRLVDSRCTVKIAQDWGAQLVTHKQAGHDITLDDPTWVLKNIQTHLSEGKRPN